MTLAPVVIDLQGAQPGSPAPEPQTRDAGRVFILRFDAAADETILVGFPVTGYAAGSIKHTILWGAETATSGNVVWSIRCMAITPETDTASMETGSFATADTVTDGHLGTTAERIMSCTITQSTNLDGLANGDFVWFELRRDADNGSDTMTGDANLVGWTIEEV